MSPSAFRPIRSYLFAPGSRREILAKLPRSGPDAAVIDLEDAVAESQKEEARANAAEAVPRLVGDSPGLTVLVRVNSVGTSWFRADVAALSQSVTGVIVPKLESAAEVSIVVSALGEAGLEVPVVAGIETALGVENVREILESHVAAVYFGAEDFATDVGGSRTVQGLEVLYARSRVVLAARLGGVAAIDQAVLRIADQEAFIVDAQLGRALGYSGKICIHPSQVRLAHEVFTPTDEEIAWAERLLRAHAEALGSGRAVFVMDGVMVDEPLVRRAEVILNIGARRQAAQAPEERESRGQ